MLPTSALRSSKILGFIFQLPITFKANGLFVQIHLVVSVNYADFVKSNEQLTETNKLVMLQEEQPALCNTQLKVNVVITLYTPVSVMVFCNTSCGSCVQQVQASSLSSKCCFHHTPVSPDPLTHIWYQQPDIESLPDGGLSATGKDGYEFFIFMPRNPPHPS